MLFNSPLIRDLQALELALESPEIQVLVQEWCLQHGSAGYFSTPGLWVWCGCCDGGNGRDGGSGGGGGADGDVGDSEGGEGWCGRVVGMVGW